MNCDAIKELLWAYLEKETTAEETAEIETHLAHCAACREEWKLQKELKNALASLPDEELPEGYHTELMQKLQAEKKAFPAKKKYGWKQLSMIAAAVLVVVAAGGMKGMLEMRQNQNETVQRMMLEEADGTANTDLAANADLAAAEAEQDTENVAENSAKPEAKKNVATPKQDTRKSVSVGAGAEGTAKEKASVSQEEQNALPKMAVYAEEAERAMDEAIMFSNARSADDNAVASIDSVTLAVAEKAAALQAICESIEKCGGYEESVTDDAVQAVIPAEKYQAFLQELGKLGELQKLSQAEADGAPRTIHISVTEK